METQWVSYQELHTLITKVFIKHGFNEVVALSAADTLALSDVRGIDSHGIARLKGYLRLTNEGRINPLAQPKTLREFPATISIDGDKGLGLWLGEYAMNIAIQKAKTTGTGWATVSNSTHFGIGQAHAEMAVKHKCIGFAMTNASPLVAPAGSSEPYIGTNPICFVFPAGKYGSFICDIATSAVSNGKLELKQRAGLEMPLGWAQDENGYPSSNPKVLSDKGTLLPLGSDIDHSYHKGYALGSVVDLFCGVLSGANFGMWVPPFVSFLQVQDKVGEGIGHFLGAWSIESFMDYKEFISRIEKWIEGVKSLQVSPLADEILYPGEPEHRMEAHRRTHGIPIPKQLWDELQAMLS